MTVDAFRRQVLESKYRPDVDVDYESDTDDKYNFAFHTPREVTPRNIISDYGIDTYFNDENKQLDTPGLESKNLLHKQETKEQRG